MSKGKIVIIGSNATRIEVQGGGTGATGQYLNETVVPAMAFVEADYDVVLATPNGTKPHIDEASDSAQHFAGDDAAYRRARAFFADHPSMQARTLRSVIDEGLDHYAAVFVPGGQAPVVDDSAVAAHRDTPHYKDYLLRIGDLAERTALVLTPVAIESGRSQVRQHISPQAPTQERTQT
jgi:hypothetical protein